MNNKICIFLLIAAALFFIQCSQKDYHDTLIGTWELTGDRCDESGECKKEIITDAGARESFMKEGLYVTGRSRNNYEIRGSRLKFASVNNSCAALEAEILSIKSGVLLLRCSGSVRRYAKIEGR